MRSVSILVAALIGGAAFADDGITKDQGDLILNELRQIRRLLEEQSKRGLPPERPVTRLTLDVGDSPILGKADAPLTIVGFTDYQCPFCQRFHLASFSLIKRDYIDTGKVRFVSRDFPLVEIHPNALRAAQAARCAGAQSKFWEMHDLLQRNGSALELSNLVDYAGSLKLDPAAFRACVESQKFKSAVEAEAAASLASGIGATPSFVLGKSTATGVEGDLIQGALSYDVFSSKLKALLEETSAKQTQN